MTSITAARLQEMWTRHDREWRDPCLAISPWAGSQIEPNLLRMRWTGQFWETLDRLQVTLLITREYEHLIMALTTQDGRPFVSHLPLPHPSGLAVDRRKGAVSVASTRNPNQVYELVPATSSLARSDVKAPDMGHRPLVPVRSNMYAGALYIHDLAYIGGELHANSVGQNAIVRLPAAGGHERVWWPQTIEANGKPDFGRNWLQLNSIAAGEDVNASYYSASTDAMSARRPGHRNFAVDRRGVVFSGATREPIARGLTRPHSARLHRRRLWVDNSGYGEMGVIRDGGFEPVCQLPGWTRGLSFCKDTAFVGTSRVIPRFRQYAPGLDIERSRCAVHAVDIASGAVLGSLVWPYGNQIFAVDWLPKSVSGGLPIASQGRPSTTRLRDFFYSFDNPRRRLDER